MSISGTLYTIKISHFCDKVRWALELSNASFTEVPMIPLLHVGILKKNNILGSSTTPKFVTKDGKLIPSSGEILEYLYQNGEKWLYPNQESRDLEKYFDKELSDSSRTIIYYYLFTAKDNTFLKRSFQKGFGPEEVKFVEQKFETLMKPGMMKFMNINEKTTKESFERISKIFKKVEELLSDGRKYLANTDSISAADITFAALSYPIIMPFYMQDIFVDIKDMMSIQEYKEILENFRNTIPGKYILDLYQKRGDKINFRSKI